ncbi:MAG: hypothetical protein JKY28_03295 [Sulfurimonas sp.]|nr:hypothetical protein [Sulfurimonas sp.]PHQ91396.1 MAG: hypothetical protein COB42_03535 [Sulfurimonas sp.]
MSLNIIIEGNLSTSDAKSLHEQLSTGTHSSIDFEFKGTEYLPYIIVIDLLNIETKLQIVTSQKSLYLYLSNLGIKNDYINEHKLQKTNYVQKVKAIAIGGSAGSIDGLIKIVKDLRYTNISIFVTLHILPDKDSLLSSILNSTTDYNVIEATDNIQIKEHTIYIAPPNKHMIIKDNYIFLNDEEHVNFSRPSISLMYDSLAKEYTNSLLCILLCGYGKDGSSSMDILDKNGCEILLQNPDECEAKDMIVNATQASKTAQVLNLSNIQSYLELKLAPIEYYENEIKEFLQKVYDTYGYDYRNYELKSIKRRIEFVRLQVNANSLNKFKQMVLKDKNIFKELQSAFSINITEFFRNTEVFKKIYEDILPDLSHLKYLRVWCAGCSRGDEPYTVAILLKKAGLLANAQIYATDFNETIINEAINGIYPTSLYDSFKDNYDKCASDDTFEQYFDFSEKYFEVKKEIKEKILFFKHNLTTDASINEFNIIFCRNVLIYLDNDLKDRVFNLMDESLMKDGYLVLGESEAIPKTLTYLRIGNKKMKIYKK